jgi:methyltransferase
MGEADILLGFITLQRLVELRLAGRNTACLRARGGIEFGQRHYPLIVAFHAAWIFGLWWLGHGRLVDPLLLAAFLLLQLLRFWVIAALGERWTTRVIVLPGAPLVARGPYRFLRHPNYLVVAIEIALVPLALGLPVFAAVFSVINAVLLLVRVRVESAASARVGGEGM